MTTLNFLQELDEPLEKPSPDFDILEYIDEIEYQGQEQEEIHFIYRPHKTQRHLHESTARFRIATCGRRWGKTSACVMELIRFACETPRSVCWWVSPVYRQALRAFRLTKGMVKDVAVKTLRGEMRITLENGSVIEFRSADNPDTLRGEGVHFLVIDEAATVKQEAWEEVLRPTLTDTGGRAMIVGTPKGRNWFYRLWVRGQDDQFPQYQSWKFPTSSNPFIPKEEIEEARRTLPENVFRQEYLAEFLEESAGVFRGIHACIQGEEEAPKPGRRYVIGWDVAKRQDFSVFTVMDLKRKHVVHFERVNHIEYSRQLDILESLAKEYNDAEVLMDSTGVGDPLLEQAEDRGIDVQGYQLTSRSKQQLIENLAVAIERQELTFPHIPVLIHELEIFQYELTRSGNIRYEAPQGFHDDAVISLALAWWAASHHTPLQIF